MNKSYYVVIDGNTTFELLNWDYNNFEIVPELIIINSSFDQVREAFAEYEILDFYYGDDMLTSLSNYNYFTQILLQTQYGHDGLLIDTIVIRLGKKNIIQLVESLNKQINPVIDYEHMDFQSYKELRLKEVSDNCTADIYDGMEVKLMDGTTETFSFTDKDQTDLQALANLAMMNPLLNLAWHSNGNPCKMYSAVDIIIIYQTLYMKLLQDTTVCNAINMLIRNAQTKEEVDEYYWGCKLPEESQENVDAILDNMTAIVNGIKAQYVPEQDAPSNEEE